MEVMVAAQSGMHLHALRVQLKRRVSARRGGDYNEVPQAIQKKSRPYFRTEYTTVLNLQEYYDCTILESIVLKAGNARMQFQKMWMEQ